MAASPGPSTPTSTPQRATRPTGNLTSAQRSFTFPARPPTASTTTPTKNPAPTTSKQQPQQQDSSYEILFTHPNTQVIKFKAATPSLPPPSSTTNPKPPTPKIPWSSPSEVTSASGHLEIYRVQGSVSFIRSGSFLLQLLPRSQCWCVDGGGKFAFRAREMGTFYRVELPVETEEEREKVESLKAVLAGVIFYERGVCPFERGDGSTPAAEEEEAEREVVDVRRKKRRSAEGRAKAKRWHLDRAYGWKPEGWEPGMDEPEEEGRSGSASEGSGGPSEEDEEEEEDATEPEEADARAGADAPPSARQKAIQALRSASAPQSQQVPHQPSRLKPRTQMDGATAESDMSSETTAVASDPSSSALRTFQPIPTDMPPSPPDSSAGLDYSENRARFENAAVEAERARDVAGASRPEDADVESEDISAEHQSSHEQSAQVESRKLDGDVLAEDDILHHDDAQRENQISDDEDTREIEAAGSSDEVHVDRLNGTNEHLVEELDERDREVLDTFAKTDEEDYDSHIASLTHQDTENIEDQAIAAPVSVADEDDEGHTQEGYFSRHATFDDAHLVHTITQSTQRSDQPLGERTLTPTTPEPANSSEGEEEPPLSQPSPPQTPELTTVKPRTTSSEDPYAAIQARILARRSLSGTTSFHPLHKSPTRSSISSTSSSSATMISNAASRTARRHQTQNSEYSSLVTRFSTVFLGPPAHLVQIMLKIAARFAGGAFGVNGMFYSESPVDSPRKVPGGYGMDGVEEVDVAAEREWESSEEDDFGVPLHRPASGLVGEGVGARERERRGRGGEVD